MLAIELKTEQFRKSITTQIVGIVIVAHIAANFSHGQAMMPVYQFSGNQAQVTGTMTNLDAGELVISGTTSGLTTWIPQNIAHYGGSDVFLSCYDPETEDLKWVLRGGSAEDDGITSITTDPMDNLLIAGFSFGDFSMGSLHLSGNLSPNPKLLFMVKISSLGEVLEGWYIQGTEEYVLTDVASDNQGNWIICGYFKGTLFLPDTTLMSQSQSDMFLVKLNTDGQMIWVLQEGITGITRPAALTVDELGNIICGGIFDRTTRLAGQELEASSNDRDLFLAKYDDEGNGIWSRKAGGVQDDDFVDIEVNATGDIFAAGYFRGVLNLGGNLILQTNDGDPDFFLLKYDPTGSPQTAISFGSSEINHAKDIFVSGHQILFSGLFQGEWSFGAQYWYSGPFFAGFFGLFDQNLAFQGGYAVSSTEGLSPSAGVLDENGNAWLSMSFAGASQIDEFHVVSTGEFDGLILKVLTTTSNREEDSSGTWRIYPNPVADRIHVEDWQSGDTFQITDLNGTNLISFEFGQEISLSHLPRGIYIVNCTRAGRRETIRLVKVMP